MSDTDTTEVEIDDSELKGPELVAHRAKLIVAHLRKRADLDNQIKAIKAKNKADGLNDKAMARVVRSLLKGPDFHADQVQLQLEFETYCEAVALPTDLEAAQAAVAEAAAKIPESEGDIDPDKFKGTSIKFGDGPYIAGEDFAKATKKLKRALRDGDGARQ